MKKGDKVTVRDGSYSRSVVNGKPIHEIGSLHGEQFVIIETDCRFPVLNKYQQMNESVSRFNNTVIQAIDSGKVVFIEERFLRLVEPTHKVMVDTVFHSGCGGYGIVGGEVIEISDKLYKEIKKS